MNSRVLFLGLSQFHLSSSSPTSSDTVTGTGSNKRQVLAYSTPPSQERPANSAEAMMGCFSSDSAEEEKRQDVDSSSSYNDCCAQDDVRRSPHSSSTVNVRCTRLFCNSDDILPGILSKPTTNTTTTTVTKKMEATDLWLLSSSSHPHSLVSSMFLVSPLKQPSLRRSRRLPRVDPAANSDEDDDDDNDAAFKAFKASLIDSSKTILRPLTPPHHKRHKITQMNFFLEEEADESKDDGQEYSHDAFNRNNHHVDQRQSPPSSHRSLLETNKLMDAAATSASTTSYNDSTTTDKPKQRWLIPAEHPCKMLWDVLTFLLSFVNAYATHQSIRDRQYGFSWMISLCEVWFVLDILLNFFTEYRSDSLRLDDCRSVWARYLTTWFVIDVLSLFPGEYIYMKPIVELQNRRGWFRKNWFRSKAVVRVSRILRGRHVKMFGQAVKQTKHVGVGANRMLRLLIKYIPKYLLFFRNMKGVVAVRLLRQIHWFRKLRKRLLEQPSVAASENGGQQQRRTQSRHTGLGELKKGRHEEHNMYNEEDDGAPF